MSSGTGIRPDARSAQGSAQEVFMHLLQENAFPFPVHSVCICHGTEILQETYTAPFAPGDMHRMFSVTKSYVSLAVGALIAQDRLRLSDRVARYFPDCLPEDPRPEITEMTVLDLLTMRTCHRATTYKIDLRENWVASFFRTAPDHRPGQIFRYDTSASHTLAALVQRLTGQTVLDYLRGIFLDAAGFSPDARILTDPFGSEMGGSGLVCRPSDLVRTGWVLLSLYRQEDPEPALRAAGVFHEEAGSVLFADDAFRRRFSAYVRDAMTFHVPTLHDAETRCESAGYGLQFWMTEDGGAMMYGMGGQFLVMYPENDLLFVTTADSQGVKGGIQYILDEIARVRRSLTGPGLFGAAGSFGEDGMPIETNDSGLPPETGLPAFPSALCGDYRLMSGPAGLSSLRLSEEELVLTCRWKEQDGIFSFPFGTDAPARGTEPLYGQPLYTQAFPQPDGSLFLRARILGDYVGSLRLLLQGDGRAITLCCRRFEETLFPGMDGFAEGIRV